MKDYENDCVTQFPEEKLVNVCINQNLCLGFKRSMADCCSIQHLCVCVWGGGVLSELGSTNKIYVIIEKNM